MSGRRSRSAGEEPASQAVRRIDPKFQMPPGPPLSERPGLEPQPHRPIHQSEAEPRRLDYDLYATILHQMGIDHTRLTFRQAGRDFRLTDVHGRVVTELLA